MPDSGMSRGNDLRTQLLREGSQPNTHFVNGGSGLSTRRAPVRRTHVSGREIDSGVVEAPTTS